jgi:hypothetical protein
VGSLYCRCECRRVSFTDSLHLYSLCTRVHGYVLCYVGRVVSGFVVVMPSMVFGTCFCFVWGCGTREVPMCFMFVVRTSYTCHGKRVFEHRTRVPSDCIGPYKRPGGTRGVFAGSQKARVLHSV